MQQLHTAAKRIAKNTFFMYGRMVLLMAISLYTSRVVLHALGVCDYGIYNVVGSVIMMFTSLRTIFSASTQRFLNYEMGQENKTKLKDIFNLSLQVNAIISAVFLILVEIVGIWFVANKLNADPSRIYAAHIVLQFSIISAIITVFTTTFDAEIIAHERMDFYAYMAVIDASLKLAVVFIVDICNTDRLIMYGFLLLVCTIITFLCNVVFCRINFTEVRMKLVHDKSYLKKMTSFAGWNFLGSTAFALSNNGINMILNVFGGPIVNAARGIAYQMNGALTQIISNVGVVINPFIIQTYAKGDIPKFLRTIYLSSKVFYILQLLIVSFFTFLAKDVIRLWLGYVPQYLNVFLIIVLWQSLIRSLQNPINIYFFSIGKLRNFEICEGITLFLPVIVSYFLLRDGQPYYSVFISLCVFELLNLFGILLIAEKEGTFPLIPYIKQVIMPCTILLLPYVFMYVIYYHEASPISNRILQFCILLLLITSLTILIGFNKEEKKQIMSIFKK